MGNPPIPLGSTVIDCSGCPWKIGAVMLTGGERYYMLMDVRRNHAPNRLCATTGSGTSVSMMPAFLVERLWTRA